MFDWTMEIAKIMIEMMGVGLIFVGAIWLNVPKWSKGKRILLAL